MICIGSTVVVHNLICLFDYFDSAQFGLVLRNFRGAIHLAPGTTSQGGVTASCPGPRLSCCCQVALPMDMLKACVEDTIRCIQRRWKVQCTNCVREFKIVQVGL